ncbi:trypsin-like peptidase domain-containing protein [Oculatella sp. LEGE 06141]|nr:trypsin-like peptidase domain-containing protein [Oculatella sp. LEGE 06141]
MAWCGVGMVAGMGLAYLAFSGLFAQLLPGTGSVQIPTPVVSPTQPLIPNDQAVADIARQVTVRVLGEPGSGSGVLLSHQANTYTVLTCEHVVAQSQSDRYTILTADGITHSARRVTRSALAHLDLALLEFESETAYRVVRLGDSNAIAVGDRVYASGFPNYRFLDAQNQIESTRDWGTKAYHLTTGEVSLLLGQSLQGGYRLGYTNEIEQGMSGGPVVDRLGRLVGITGRLKYPLQGIEAYTFADGTRPSEALFQQMETLSWAVPIASFQTASGQ